MLEDTDAMATVAVKDLAAARKFYEGTLGLKPLGGVEQQALIYQAGRSRLLVYKSQLAGTNKATTVTWTVGEDVEGAARDLNAKGVVFEHYDFPGITRVGDVHVAGRMKNAWFKDPDGNIHALVNG